MIAPYSPNWASVSLNCSIFYNFLCELRRTPCMRVYEKSSNTGDPPRHQADHGSIYERFSTRTRPLVVLAHPPVLVDPRDRPLHHPSPRQHHEAFRGHQFCQSAFTPSLAHSLAHAISTSSGAGFRGRSTTSTLHPRVFLTQSAPLSSPR